MRRVAGISDPLWGLVGVHDLLLARGNEFGLISFFLCHLEVTLSEFMDLISQRVEVSLYNIFFAPILLYYREPLFKINHFGQFSVDFEL